MDISFGYTDAQHNSSQYSGWECLSKISQDISWGLCFTARSMKFQEMVLGICHHQKEESKNNSCRGGQEGKLKPDYIKTKWYSLFSGSFKGNLVTLLLWPCNITILNHYTLLRKDVCATYKVHRLFLPLPFIIDLLFYCSLSFLYVKSSCCSRYSRDSIALDGMPGIPLTHPQVGKEKTWLLSHLQDYYY